MKLSSAFPQRLIKVDNLTLSDHSYLNQADEIYFIKEYTARQGFSYSPTNSLILNFKKSMARRGMPDWHYKDEAIRTAAGEFRLALHPEALDSLTFVPIPPSKAKADPLHDDRLTRMLNAIRPKPRLDIRELIVQTESTEAAHRQARRPRPEEIERLYHVNESLTKPAPNHIALVDDMLTTGAHFRAAQSILSNHFPQADFVGLFLSRRVPYTSDPEDFSGGSF